MQQVIPALQNHSQPYCALASDGDGTLLRNGHMGRETMRALQQLRAADRKVFLVTGETPEKLADFPHLELFNLVVAENGALLYEPVSRLEESLGAPPPSQLLRALRRKGVKPLEIGRVIISMECKQEQPVIEILQELAIGWQMIRNRNHVMLLPASINKATGLAAALRKFGLSPRQVVGVGDAENDLPLLKFCGCGVAVANAVPQLKEQADLITEHGMGAGVVELIQDLLNQPFGSRDPDATGKLEP